jgi:hypothetical protein
MTPTYRAYVIRQQAEAHARQRVPLAELSHARVLDEALAITADNLANALSELDALRAKEHGPTPSPPP